ncbi:MAG: efflux RND transporter periplasmic adaptor subunit [Myxococcota bacterium]|nr:efflux RND transporter periplasmic adaptor subunit [Myxococcota bacterium]
MPPSPRASSLLALACLLAACGGEKEVPTREIVRPVKTFVFGDAGNQREFQYPGTVYANRTVEVAFEVAGKLEDLPVAKGQEVATGDLLGRLDQRDFSNEVAAARASLEEAEATRGRYEEAARSNAVSRRELDEARARARIAAADLKIKQKALEDSEIRASFDGIVADRLVDNFQNVQAKEPVLRLQDISVLEIRVNIPERDATGPTDAPVGDLSATFDAVPGRRFPLTIKEVVTQADPITQTYAVTLMMPRPQGVEILPGMTSTVTWHPSGEFAARSNTVPTSALVGRQGTKPWVWVLDEADMTVSRREVEVGSIVSQNQIQLVSGLESGEVIAAAGVHHLTEGMKVAEYR